MATQLSARTPAGSSETAGERPATAGTVFTERARYFDSGNAFALNYQPVPCHQFLVERDRAFDPATGTAIIPLDLSDRLESEFPATTPLILARYLRIRAGERLATRLKASAELYYVIAGAGETSKALDAIRWGPGDVFCLPGGGETSHVAGEQDCVLWSITNEPQLAFEHLEPPASGNAVTGAVHYPADEVAAQLARVQDKLGGERRKGLALIFSSAQQAHRRNIMPSLTLAMNQLPAHDYQRPHRHNSVAVTLNIACEGCYSMIDGKRVDWQPFATMVTPPAAVHSHHNDGDATMTCLIVQDGGLHTHCRTMDFRYAG